MTFTTFPAFRHLVQTFMFFTEPWYCPFIFLRFGFHRRLVLLFAWLTLFPKRGPLSHTSHRWAIHLLLRYEIDCFTKGSMLAYRRNWGKWFWIKYVNHKTDHHWRDNQLLPWDCEIFQWSSDELWQLFCCQIRYVRKRGIDAWHGCKWFNHTP